MKTIYPVFVTFVTHGGLFDGVPRMTFFVLKNPVDMPKGIVELMDNLDAKYGGSPTITFILPMQPQTGPELAADKLAEEYGEVFKCPENLFA